MDPYKHLARLAVPLTLMAAAGCAVKAPPDTDALQQAALPGVATPAAWAAGAPGAITADWVATFNDPQLAATVSDALAHNADLRVAAARVEQALLYARLAGARVYPSAYILARGGGKMSGDNSGLQGAVLTVNWELDIW